MKKQKTRDKSVLAKADHSAAYKRLPVQDGRDMSEAVSLNDPGLGKNGFFFPQTQLFDAAAAAPDYDTASRVVATIAARWPRIVRLGCCDDFGIAAAEHCIKQALQAFAELNRIPGYDPEVEKSEWGASLVRIKSLVR